MFRSRHYGFVSSVVLLSSCLLLGFLCRTEGFGVSTKNICPVRTTSTSQYLFNLPNKVAPSKSRKSREWIISTGEREMEETLCFEEIDFPYCIELEKNSLESSSSSGGYPSPSDLLQNMESISNNDIDDTGNYRKDEVAQKRLILRHLEDEDLPVALRLIIREYGSYSTEKQGEQNPIMKWIDSYFKYYENYVFSWIVGLGLLQRIKRRKECDVTHEEYKPSFLPDHNVICIEEETTALASNGTPTTQTQIVGMAELSVQPCNPERTSPPYVLPMFVKKALGTTTAYVSNVLITNEFRGLGYSKILMYTCEGLARSWGYDSIYLHVDASVTSGKSAQGLYLGLGYQPVITQDTSDNNDNNWSFTTGPNMMSRGVYMVDGLPLIYLKKELNDSC